MATLEIVGETNSVFFAFDVPPIIGEIFEPRGRVSVPLF